jgi:molecular chaperone DnaK (HSP70)
LASKFVDTSISLVRQAILSAENELKQSEELGKDEVLIVHDIIPVGGTSHLHIVKTKLEAAFPSVRVVASQDREFSVAKGAAIWAANLGMYNEVITTALIE